MLFNVFLSQLKEFFKNVRYTVFVKEVWKMNSVILEARSLTKEYKQTLALDHINLQIKRVKFMVLSVRMGLARLLF